MDLSVVIVSWNTHELLGNCLESLFSALDELSVEVLVVDNASSDLSCQMVRSRFPQAILLRNQVNVGFARANNIALRQARGKYVLLLNSDTEIPHGALQRLLALAETRESAGIIGVKLVNPDGTFQAAWNRFPTFLAMLLEGWGLMARLTRNRYYPSCPPSLASQDTQCDWVGGACLLARAEAIRAVGPLDERFFMNCEEMDWCYRMHRAGWQVWYTPSVEILHHGGASASRKSYAALAALYQSKIAFASKYHGLPKSRILKLNLRLSSLAKMLVWLARSIVLGVPEYRERGDVFRRLALEEW